MYNEVKTVIESGNYELVDMLAKIDKLWLEAKLTDEQREELTEMARENADYENSMPDVSERLLALENAVRELQEKVEELETGEPPTQEVKEYEASHQYKKGEKCLWEGEVYEWALDVHGVWSPGDYPQGWSKVE